MSLDEQLIQSRLDQVNSAITMHTSMLAEVQAIEEKGQVVSQCEQRCLRTLQRLERQKETLQRDLALTKLSVSVEDSKGLESLLSTDKLKQLKHEGKLAQKIAIKTKYDGKVSDAVLKMLLE